MSKRRSPPVSRTPARPSQKFSAPAGSGGKPADFVSIPKGWRVIVGHHAIQEAFRESPENVRELWLKSGFESSQDLREYEKIAREKNIKVHVKSVSFLDRLSMSHQGAALLKEGRPQLDDSSSKEVATYLLLDGIEDPHNLGAILRTGWLMDVEGILIPQDRAVDLTPTVHKVACGGAEHVPVESHSNFSQTIEKLKEEGFWVFGLSHKAKKSVFDLKIPEKIVWAIGAEDKGLRTTTERLCDELVSIPQVAAAASYNASVAAAIALTETFRQRRN